MQDLPFELIETVVDFMVAGVANDLEKVAAVIPSLTLINKHWREAIRGHKLNLIACFDFDGTDRSKKWRQIYEWLIDSYRRKSARVDLHLNGIDSRQLKSILDRLERYFPHIVYKRFGICVDARNTPATTIQLPQTLTARELEITGDDYVRLDWSCFGRRMRRKLEVLTLTDLRHDHVTRKRRFKNLKELYVSGVRIELMSILRYHRHITTFKLRSHQEEATVPISFLDSLQYLYAEAVNIYFPKVELNTLREVHIVGLTDFGRNSWRKMPSSIERLTIEGCGHEQQGGPRDEELFGNMSKLENLKHFKVSRSVLPCLTNLFNNRDLNSSMPHLVEIWIDLLEISTEPFNSFVEHHRELKSVHFEPCHNYRGIEDIMIDIREEAIRGSPSSGDMYAYESMDDSPDDSMDNDNLDDGIGVGTAAEDSRVGV